MPPIGFTPHTFRPFILAAAVVISTLIVVPRSFAQTPIPIANLKRATPVNFDQDVLPILQKNCLACHNAAEANGELILESAAAILAGGDSGPAAVPRNSKDSLLLTVASHSKKPIMPPRDNDVAAKNLTSEELGILKLWIDQGARGSPTSGVVSPKNWRPLPPGDKPIYAVAVTPDGQFAACSRANQIFIYHVPTGQLVTRLTDPKLQAGSKDSRAGIAHLDVVHSLAFNSAGDMLASGGFRVVKLWRYPRDVRRMQFAAGAAAVQAVAVSSDGKLLATGAADNSVKLWSLPSGQPRATLKGHTGAITGLRFNGDATQLVSASEDKSIRVWRTDDGQPVGRIDTPSPVAALTLVKAPPPTAAPNDPQTAEKTTPQTPAEHIVSGGDNFLRLWQMPDSLPSTLADVPPKTTLLAVSPDRKLLAMATSDGTIRVSDADSDDTISSWKAHEAAITGVAFKPITVQQPAAGDKAENKPESVPVLATCSEDQTVRLWNYRSGEPLGAMRGTLAAVRGISFAPDGKRLVAGGADGTVTVWNLETAAPRMLEKAAATGEVVAAVSPDGKLMATSGVADGRSVILVRDIATGKITRTLMGHDAAIAALAFSPDSSKIASGAADKSARIWDLSDDKFPEFSRFDGHADVVTAVAFNADGQQLLTGSAAGSVKLSGAADAKEVMSFPGHTASVVAVAMVGNQPVSASADKTIRFWNAADGKQIRAVTETVAITAMTVARDGGRLAAATADNNVKLYQAADSKLLHTLGGHKAAARSLAFSADGARLVSTAADNVAVVWSVADGRLLELLPAGEGLSYAAFALPVAPATVADSVLFAQTDGSVHQRGLQFAMALGAADKSISAVAYHPGAQAILAAGADGTVKGFNAANGQLAFTANHGAAVHDLAISADGQRMASAGEDKLVKLWNATNGAALNPPQLTGFSGPVTRLCFSSDGTQVVAASGGETPELLAFNVADGGLQQALIGHTTAVDTVVAAGTSRPRILSAAGVETVRSWQLHGLRRINNQNQPVVALAAIPTAPMQVVSGGASGVLRHWNLATGQPIGQPMNHGGAVTAVAVRPDGQRFASAGVNNVGKLWNATNYQQVAEMKGDIRAKTRLAKLTQTKAAASAAATQAQTALKAAEEDLPKKMAAQKTAADALAAAKIDVEAKAAALTTAETAKAEAEKLAIEMAAAAQQAAKAREQADQLALTTAATAKLMMEKAAAAKAVASASPEDMELTKLAEAAGQVAGQSDAEAKAAESAKAAPTKAAADAAKIAGDAATKAIATNKPYTDALTALKTAQDAERQAAQVHEIAARDAKLATDLVPVGKAELVKLQADVEKVTADLEAATQAAAEAEKPIHTVSFSPDNLNLATGGDFNVVHTWDATTGTAVASYVGHQGPIRAVAYTDDGAIVSGADDNSAAVWELNPSWRLERTIGSIDDPTLLIDRVTSVDFSPDGTLLATGGGVPSRNGEVKIWKVEDGSLSVAIPEAHTDGVFSVAFSHNGQFVASASADKYIRTFDVASGKQVNQFEGHTNHVLGVSWRADGKMLASCGADNTVRIWNAKTGDRIRNIAGFNKQVFAIRYVGQSPNTISCSGDRLIRMHNSDNGQVARNYAGTGSDYVYCLDITPNGATVVAGGHDSILRIWDGNQNNVQPVKAIEPPKLTDRAVAEAAKESAEQ